MYNGITRESLINSSEKNNATEVEASGGTTELTAEEIALLGDAAGISDGVYTGTASGFRGLMTVEVTVSKQMITQVKVTDHVDDAKWYNRANRVIPDEIIDTQSTDISAVSGATYSSYGIINAVKNALENATAQ